MGPFPAGSLLPKGAVFPSLNPSFLGRWCWGVGGGTAFVHPGLFTSPFP